MISRCKNVSGKPSAKEVFFDRVYSVICSGCENWSWSRAVIDRVKGLENEDPEKTIQDEEGRGRNDAKVRFEDNPNGKEHLETTNEAPTLNGILSRRNLKSNGVGPAEKKHSDADIGKGLSAGVFLAGTEHEAGPRKLHILEAHVVLAQERVRLDKIATLSAGEEERTSRRKKKTNGKTRQNSVTSTTEKRTGDFVQHVVREPNQEDDQRANLGAKRGRENHGVRKDQQEMESDNGMVGWQHQV